MPVCGGYAGFINITGFAHRRITMNYNQSIQQVNLAYAAYCAADDRGDDIAPTLTAFQQAFTAHKVAFGALHRVSGVWL